MHQVTRPAAAALRRVQQQRAPASLHALQRFTPKSIRTGSLMGCAAVASSLQSALGSFVYASSARETFSRSYSRQRKLREGDDLAAKEELRVDKITVIGGGNMADAIITGLLSEKLVPSDKIVVSDPNPDIRQKYKTRNIRTSDLNATAVEGADVIVLAVKPQVLPDVMDSFKDEMKHDALVLSVVAGATIDNMQDVLGSDSRIIRSMPNTPAMIGEGMTVWSQSSDVTEAQHALTRSILGAFGVEVFVDDESALDMATALSGSGPAYFFLVAEAMIDTGVHMGFSRAVATKLVQQTMLGSALYMQSSNAHPVELRNNITSPGGTTAAALYRAEKNGFRAVIADSIWAAYERCMELGSPVPVTRKRPRS